MPDGDAGVTIQLKLRQLYYFSVAYLDVYKPLLDRQVSGNDVPWSRDFFEGNKISLKNAKTERSLNNVRDYCEDFLVWFANVQHSKDDDGKFGPIVDFNLTDIVNRISSDEAMGCLEAKGLNRLWRNMCSARGKGDGTLIGKFLSALYRNCEKIK